MQTLNEYKIMLGGALNIGVTPQAVPYVGIAKVLDFIHATNEILESRGIKLPLEGQSTTSPETRYEKGLEVQKSIFGGTAGYKYIKGKRFNFFWTITTRQASIWKK